MKTKDSICDMSIKRLHASRDRGCEYSFLRYLDDLRERLEILDDQILWEQYGKYLEETIDSPPTSH